VVKCEQVMESASTESKEVIVNVEVAALSKSELIRNFGNVELGWKRPTGVPSQYPVKAGLRHADWREAGINEKTMRELLLL